MQVHTSSLALETAALDSLDALLQRRMDHLAVERSNQLLAGAAVVLAAVLLWLFNRPSGPFGAGFGGSGESSAGPSAPTAQAGGQLGSRTGRHRR